VLKSQKRKSAQVEHPSRVPPSYPGVRRIVHAGNFSTAGPQSDHRAFHYVWQREAAIDTHQWCIISKRAGCWSLGEKNSWRWTLIFEHHVVLRRTLTEKFVGVSVWRTYSISPQFLGERTPNYPQAKYRYVHTSFSLAAVKHLQSWASWSTVTHSLTWSDRAASSSPGVCKTWSTWFQSRWTRFDPRMIFRSYSKNDLHRRNTSNDASREDSPFTLGSQQTKRFLSWISKKSTSGDQLVVWRVHRWTHSTL